ncbi:MAG: hypothetical protein HFE49_05035 [Clostridia bacterium]|nr:hypothetical protein [Clostridia bacterium]
MASEVRARTKAAYRRRNTIFLFILVLLSCFALVMAAYNLVKSSWLFFVAWLIAAILASTYVLIRINTVYPSYIAADRESLYMKNWTNDFLPYDYGNKIKLLSEFIPAKTKIVEIPLDEICTVMIGTKNFIKRNVRPETNFVKNIRSLEKTKDFYRKKTISSMDIFYVETYSGECYYMPIVNFDTGNVIKIVKVIQNVNPGLAVKTSGRDYRSLRIKQ